MRHSTSRKKVRPSWFQWHYEWSDEYNIHKVLPRNGFFTEWHDVTMNENFNGLYPEMLLSVLRSMKNGYIHKIKISIFVGNILQGTVSCIGHSLRLQASTITGSLSYRAHASKCIITELHTHTHTHTHMYTLVYTGWFVSPSGITDLCGTVAGMATPKESMSTKGETLQVSVLPYRCSIAPFCCVCLGCCAAEFGISRGTYELLCIYVV
jgi:hypothetical protein